MFGKRIEIFRLFGFPIRIDLSWLLILFLVTYSLATGYFPANHPAMPTTAYWAMGLTAAIGLFMSILFHELAHSLVGRHYHLPIDGITLFIFGGVAEMREEAESPRVEFLMSAVGPLASAVLAMGFFYLRHLCELNEWNRTYELIFYYLGFMNMILAIFNLVPAFPLDGGRMFRSILWAIKKDFDWATQIAAKIGWGFGWLLISYGVFSLARGNTFGGLWYMLIGYFLKQASSLSGQQVAMKKKMETTKVAELMQRGFIQVHAEDTFEQIERELAGREVYPELPVIDGGRLVGFLPLVRLEGLNRESWLQARVGQFIDSNFRKLSIAPQESAWVALEAMKQGRWTHLFVVEEGRMIGEISAKDLLAWLKQK